MKENAIARTTGSGIKDFLVKSIYKLSDEKARLVAVVVMEFLDSHDDEEQLEEEA